VIGPGDKPSVPAIRRLARPRVPDDISVRLIVSSGENLGL